MRIAIAYHIIARFRLRRTRKENTKRPGVRPRPSSAGGGGAWVERNTPFLLVHTTMTKMVALIVMSSHSPIHYKYALESSRVE